MKKYLLLAVGICLFQSAFSQKARLNLYSAYVFDDHFDSYYDPGNYYEGKITGGLQWGAGLEYLPHPRAGVELVYFGQYTTAPTSYQTGYVPKYANLDLDMNYIMLGGNKYVRPEGGRVEGFGGLQAGMVIVSAKNPESGYSNSATKFAWGARLGAIIWASDKVGIKLQMMLLSAVQSAGGGLYFGTGGLGAGVSTYSSIYQFSLGGGLVFNLGQGGGGGGNSGGTE